MPKVLNNRASIWMALIAIIIGGVIFAFRQSMDAEISFFIIGFCACMAIISIISLLSKKSKIAENNDIIKSETKNVATSQFATEDEAPKAIEEPQQSQNVAVKENSVNLISEAEYDMRKSMANTYLILCAINGIRNKIRDERSETRIRLDKLSNMIYYMYYSRTAIVPLRKEIENIRTYIEFQRLKMRNNLEIKYVLPQSNHKTQIWSLTFLPFLSDIFKNAGDQLRIECKITEHAEVIVFDLTYSTTQNGENTTSTIGSDGFERLRQRLNEKYPDKHFFILNRSLNDTSIKIQIETQQIAQTNTNNNVNDEENKEIVDNNSENKEHELSANSDSTENNKE